MIDSENGLHVEKQFSGESQRFPRVAGFAGPEGDVNPQGQRVEMIDPELRSMSGSSSRQSRNASRASPVSPVHWAMLMCVVSVSG